MSRVQQLMVGLLLMAIGGVKTWLHMGAIPMLALPTCTGKTVYIAANQASWFEQAHCWGCYALAAGAGIVLFAGYQALRERRSVAIRMD